MPLIHDVSSPLTPHSNQICKGFLHFTETGYAQIEEEGNDGSFEFLHFVSFREAIATRNLYDLSFFKISPFGRNDRG